MPGPLFHVNATATCPHAGQVTVMSVNMRVMVGGQPVATVADQSFVVGCPFTVPPGKPQPCITVKWLMPAARVTVNGQPALLQTSASLCLSPEQIPQGPPLVTGTQARVVAT
jgi:uncharacterized Zn-binding protein involved in type VI secretion